MRNLILILAVTFCIFGCENTKDSSNVTDTTAEDITVKKEQKFSKADIKRVNEILDSLRNPKFEINQKRASGPNTSLGLGIREGEITSYHDLVVDYEDSEIVQYKNLLANELNEIYKHAEYRQIHDEVYRLYKLFGIDYAKQAIVKHCLDTKIKSEFRQWAMFQLSKLLFKNADDKTLKLLIPLLTDRDEEIRCDCVSIFKSTKAKFTLPELLLRFNDKDETTKVKLYLINAICAIDKKYQKMGAKYANDLYLNTKSKKDHNIHDLALYVASEINDDSTLEMMLEFTKEGCYTEKFLDSLIYPLARYQRDERVQKLFFKILSEDEFGNEIKMSVLNRYSKSDEKSIRVIKEIIDKYIEDRESEYYLMTISTDGIRALGEIGDKDAIEYLEKLKDTYKGYDYDIEIAINSIKDRLNIK